MSEPESNAHKFALEYIAEMKKYPGHKMVQTDRGMFNPDKGIGEADDIFEFRMTKENQLKDDPSGAGNIAADLVVQGAFIDVEHGITGKASKLTGRLDYNVVANELEKALSRTIHPIIPDHVREKLSNVFMTDKTAVELKNLSEKSTHGDLLAVLQDIKLDYDARAKITPPGQEVKQLKTQANQTEINH